MQIKDNHHTIVITADEGEWPDLPTYGGRTIRPREARVTFHPDRPARVLFEGVFITRAGDVHARHDTGQAVYSVAVPAAQWPPTAVKVLELAEASACVRRDGGAR